MCSYRQYSRLVVSRVKKGGTSTYYGKGKVMVDSPEQLIILWEYGSTSGFKEQRNDGCFIWATYCGEGGALWFDWSLVITTAAQQPGWIFPCSCVVHSILLHGRWSRMKDVQHVGETKLNCFWHCYQSFRICLYVHIILMKFYCDAMKVSTLVPAGKKRLQLTTHVSCLEIISLQHSIKYKWNYHG